MCKHKLIVLLLFFALFNVVNLVSAEDWSDDFISSSVELSNLYAQLAQVNAKLTNIESEITNALNDMGRFSDKAFPNYWSERKKLKKEKQQLEASIAALEAQQNSGGSLSESSSSESSSSGSNSSGNSGNSGTSSSPTFTTPAIQSLQSIWTPQVTQFFASAFCFTAETKLPSGTTIAHMWSHNLKVHVQNKAGFSSKKTVVFTGIYQGQVYMFLDARGNFLLPGNITQNHLVLLKEGNILTAKEIKVGQKLICGSGEIVEVAKIQTQYYQGPVYNILNGALAFSFSKKDVFTFGALMGKLQQK